MERLFDLIEEGRLKRYFSVRYKRSFEGAITHITQHASGTEPLFLEESDYLYMLHLVKKASERFRLKVLSFALMLNHIHLLLRLGDSNLAEAMQILFQSYAKYFNKKYERKGHVFCGAYRSALCFDETYLLAASLYIHFNPVKANIVEDPIGYRWSSCALFLSGRDIDSFVDYRFVLGVLNKDASVAALEYKRLLQRLNTREINDIFEQPRALELFVGLLKERGLYGKDDLDKKIKALKEKKRLTKPEDIKARKFLIEQLKARGYSIPDIADRLALSRQTVYEILI